LRLSGSPLVQWAHILPMLDHMRVKREVLRPAGEWPPLNRVAIDIASVRPLGRSMLHLRKAPSL
jgi:hypothetical protein